MAEFIVRIEFHNVKEHYYGLYQHLYELMDKLGFKKNAGKYDLPSAEYYIKTQDNFDTIFDSVKKSARSAISLYQKNEITYSAMVIEATHIKLIVPKQ